MNTNTFLAGVCAVILLVTVAALSGLGIIDPSDKSMIVGFIVALPIGGAGGFIAGKSSIPAPVGEGDPPA